ESWCWIKGVSGAGKTTLLGLLLGLFGPCEGKITVGGVDPAMADRGHFFSRISVVHQDPYLFNDTILNNILMGDKAREEALGRALGISGVDRLVSSLPLGYNTRVGEYGSTLSGGQKQRIAIARALAREPDMLVLDEATSFLDAGSENSVFEGIKRHFPGMTVIFVTHRDTVSAYADMTLVVRDGKVISEEEFCGYDGKGAGKGA
ncbi:MAG: ATP-binding cassette domain-containing protein, partial [Candidatus Omnitrophica bacterium]|nr:ATP-binding cassette domain-containing protein [Candidatus Omnitrophota bacterium]